MNKLTGFAVSRHANTQINNAEPSRNAHRTGAIGILKRHVQKARNIIPWSIKNHSPSNNQPIETRSVSIGRNERTYTEPRTEFEPASNENGADSLNQRESAERGIEAATRREIPASYHQLGINLPHVQTQTASLETKPLFNESQFDSVRGTEEQVARKMIKASVGHSESADQFRIKKTRTQVPTK